MTTAVQQDKKWLRVWLLAGVVMVLVQILLGGITRLTGSGLSITRWDIVTGTLPPLNQTEWEEAFALYQQTPQYQKINEGMDMPEFKFIFFWEYVHRLWARSMGLVFFFPFLYFIWKRWLTRETLFRLGVVVLMAGLAAVFGWIMVSSGLVDRPWVNAYKLTVHLGLGITLFLVLFYTWWAESGYPVRVVDRSWLRATSWLISLVILQICFGGFVSGMRSALLYPTWPDMHGTFIPSIVLDPTHWNTSGFLLYDQSGFMPALVQVIHRNLGYLILVTVIFWFWRWIKTQDKEHHWMGYVLLAVVATQVGLGILTLLFSKGSIPVLYGVAHQGVGILFLTFLLYIRLSIQSIK